MCLSVGDKDLRGRRFKREASLPLSDCIRMQVKQTIFVTFFACSIVSFSQECFCPWKVHREQLLSLSPSTKLSLKDLSMMPSISGSYSTLTAKVLLEATENLNECI